MKLFSVTPFDQHLYLDGRDITKECDKDTLASLHILPGSVIYLKVCSMFQCM